MMMRLCYLFLTIPFLATAQSQTNYWYFGNKAGLNFKYFPPRIWNNSQMKVFGGGVTVSDSTGKLLFYTNGTQFGIINIGLLGKVFTLI